MPTVSEVIGGWLDTAVKNPRSTVSSILTTILFVIPTILQLGVIHGKAAIIMGGIAGSAKLIWGAFFEKDPNQQLANVPGIDKPVMVPSHEIPNDPAAKPVIPKP